jgi:hypothetical protein
MTVIEIDARRPIPCPHCDGTFTPRQLDGHLRWYCPVLLSKRRHPAGKGLDGGGGDVA